MPRRSERLAIKEAMRYGRRSPSSSEPEPEPEPEQEVAVDIHADERNNIIAKLAYCKSSCCAVPETKVAHEAKCGWCPTHPGWRLISHNLNIMMESLKSLRTKEARVSSALCIMSYINESAIDFAIAHKRFKQMVIQKCHEFIPEVDNRHFLYLTCYSILEKLGA